MIFNITYYRHRKNKRQTAHQLETVYDDVVLDPQTADNNAYAHVQQPTDLRENPEDNIPNSATQGNIAYAQVQS